MSVENQLHIHYKICCDCNHCGYFCNWCILRCMLEKGLQTEEIISYLNDLLKHSLGRVPSDEAKPPLILDILKKKCQCSQSFSCICLGPATAPDPST